MMEFESSPPFGLIAPDGGRIYLENQDQAGALTWQELTRGAGSSVQWAALLSLVLWLLLFALPNN